MDLILNNLLFEYRLYVCFVCAAMSQVSCKCLNVQLHIERSIDENVDLRYPQQLPSQPEHDFFSKVIIMNPQ